MIIVPNLRWRTFRYWAVRATDVWGIGLSPRGEMINICTDLNLSKTNPPTSENINKLLIFIHASPSSSESSKISLFNVREKQ